MLALGGVAHGNAGGSPWKELCEVGKADMAHVQATRRNAVDQ